MTKPRVLLADDHRVFTDGLKALLAEEFELAGVVEDGRALVKAARELRPDVIVADISMPLLNGIDAMAAIQEYDPNVRIVFLAAWPLAARAQQPERMRRIGVLTSGAAADDPDGRARGAAGTHLRHP
jgi:DNA-binding NarL/FixJ family response regulator